GPYRGPVPAVPRPGSGRVTFAHSLTFYIWNGWALAAETREADPMASRLTVALPLLCAAALVLAGLSLAAPTHATSNLVTNHGDFAGASCPGANCTLRAA